jgi:hypothetical protein
MSPPGASVCRFFFGIPLGAVKITASTTVSRERPGLPRATYSRRS